MKSEMQRNTCVQRLVGLVTALVPVLVLPLIANRASAQDQEKKPAANYQVVYLHNTAGMREANDLQTALRNMLPSAALYFTPDIGALTLRGSDADIQTAKRLITELDRPKKTYRITYTVTEIDGDKTTAPKHFSLTVSEGAKAFLKQGIKVPIVTGKYDTAKVTGPETQVQYQDVGLGIDVALDGFQDGLHLHTKFEQSAVANDSGAHADDPIISQTFMETTSSLEPGKEVSIGSVAEPNSPHHVHVSVIAEAIK